MPDKKKKKTRFKGKIDTLFVASSEDDGASLVPDKALSDTSRRGGPG